MAAKEPANQLMVFSRGGHPVTRISLIKNRLHDWVSFSMHGPSVKPLMSIPENLWLGEIGEGQIGQVKEDARFESLAQC